MWRPNLTRGDSLGVECIQHKGALSLANIVSADGFVTKFADKLWAVIYLEGLAVSLQLQRNDCVC